ncbi:MAG: chromosomal replication initiator protein DnaA [Endomicrobia bacterium]|nr:chromosomal replication initiator protein DnaA [Endomicrobiia bacterium]
MISAWELKYFSTEKYPNRYRLRIKCALEDLEELCNFLKDELSLDISPPFNVLSSDYNIGIFIYDLPVNIKNKLVDKMFSICKNGIVEDTTSLSNENPQQQKVSKKDTFPDDLGSVLTELVEQLSSRATEEEKVSKQSIFSGMPLNPKFTFENFVVGANNRFTHAAALAVAENPGKAYNPLFIYGGVGLGKTHLMQAIGHYIKKKRPLLKVVYIPADKFVTQVIEAIKAGNIQMLRDAYINVDVLLVDDVQFMAGSESTQEEFFHIFNTLHQYGKQIVLTSDRPPKLLSTLEDRLRSRFEWGLIADIKSPSLETRVAILKKKGEEEHVNVDDNILLYIASKLKSNIRELEGFLKRITAYATLNNTPINMELVKQLMSELLPEEELTEEEKALLETKKEKIEEKPKEEIKPPQEVPTPSQVKQKEVQTISIEQIYNSVQPTQQVSSTKQNILEDQKFYQDYETGVNVVEAAFFYPEGKTEELNLVKQKFAEIIKKHNLKYKLITAFDRPYMLENINYRLFVELCKTNKVNICIVISPPPNSNISAEELYNNLLPLMESENIRLEYIYWKEITKEYRYLNLALDIALSRFKII